jgi:hypothetical protein
MRPSGSEEFIVAIAQIGFAVPQSETRNLQNTPMSIRTMTTGQDTRNRIPMPTGFKVGSMIRVAIRSNMSRYGPIPIRKAAPLRYRNSLPTFCTFVSGF